MSESKPVTLAAIVAIAKNYAIGKNNNMIWHLPADLKHFKKTTMGKPIIMGRKSYESLGKPLPGRPNLVISRSFQNMPDSEASALFNDMEADFETPSTNNPVPEGPFLYASIQDSSAAAKDMAEKMDIDEIFITGGGQIYKETLPDIERLYITVLDREYEADIFFPEFDWDEWNIVFEEKHEADPEKDRPSFTFYTLERKI